MAKVIITIKIMPESPETNLEEIGNAAKSIIEKEGQFIKQEKKPVAFGLNELDLTFLLDETKAEILDRIEEELQALDGVSSAETIDVRRAIG